MNIPITVTGNLGRPAEVRFTKSGKAVTTLVVAATPRTKKDNEWQDAETIWFKVTVWDNLPETLFTKGARILASGHLFQESYEKDGVTKTSLVINDATVAIVYKSSPIPQTETYGNTWAEQPTPESLEDADAPF